MNSRWNVRGASGRPEGTKIQHLNRSPRPPRPCLGREAINVVVEILGPADLTVEDPEYPPSLVRVKSMVTIWQGDRDTARRSSEPIRKPERETM